MPGGDLGMGGKTWLPPGGGGGGQQGGGGGGMAQFTIGRAPMPQLSSVSQMNPQLAGQLDQMIARQLQENERVAQENRQNVASAQGALRQTLPNMMADPMTQGARNLAQQRLDNPESMTDQMQQRAINRASNLINASAQGAQRNMMGQAAAGGQLGGSAAQHMQNRMQDQVGNQLATMTSDLENKRALQRTADMRSAISDAQGLSQQRSGLDFGINNSILQNLPQINPQDYGGLMGLLLQAGQQGYGAGGGGGMPMGAAPP